jgi:hypothetical protein
VQAFGSEPAATLRPFHECALSEEEYNALGKSATRRGRPSNRSKAMTHALDAEVSDATFWNLVRKSQLRPSEEPSFDRFDFGRPDTSTNAGSVSAEDDDAFIEGLIRLPSFDLLDQSLGASVPGPRAAAKMSSPTEGYKFSTIFDVSSANDESAASQAMSDEQVYDAFKATRGNESVDGFLQGTSSGMDDGNNDSLYAFDGGMPKNKPKKIGRPSRKDMVSQEPFPHSMSSTVFFGAEPDSLSKLPGGSARKKVLERYHAKKKIRSYGKHIQYEARKVRAETRRRVGGRFAKNEDKNRPPSEFKGPVPA